MANRELYRLEKNSTGVIVYRTDNNYGRQGVVFSNGYVRLEYTPYAIPKYIQKEALNILGANAFELARGYTYGGQPCVSSKACGS